VHLYSIEITPISIVYLSPFFQGVLTLEHVDDEEEVKESPEHDVEFLKPREDAAKALQSAKQPLHLVAPLVEVAVVFLRFLTVCLWRHDRFEAPVENKLPGLITLIGGLLPVLWTRR